MEPQEPNCFIRVLSGTVLRGQKFNAPADLLSKQENPGGEITTTFNIPNPQVFTPTEIKAAGAQIIHI